LIAIFGGRLLRRNLEQQIRFRPSNLPAPRGGAALHGIGETFPPDLGGDTFRSVLVRRDPETVGLISPRDANGLFDLEPDAQPELLLPFEGTGVDAAWRVELPKAANSFDYQATADILLTLEYSALHSFDYRQQVIQTLDLYDVALPSVRVCRARRFLKYTAEVAALIRKFRLGHCLSTTIRKSTLSPILLATPPVTPLRAGAS
jgi:receptor-binding and translocation channel-forming TcA subunit of Tc toxin